MRESVVAMVLLYQLDGIAAGNRAARTESLVTCGQAVSRLLLNLRDAYCPEGVKMNRCEWARAEPNIAYHDSEWGVPVYDDHILFEFLTLEGAQAGLSWETVLKKRAAYREAFSDFDPTRICAYQQADVDRLLQNPGIVRNRLKVGSTITNAAVFLATQEEFGTFSSYLWQFVGGKPLDSGWKSLSEVPASSPESDALSKDLKRRGFRFVGTTICYAFMQAVGMVNDHTTDCFRYSEIVGMKLK
jgi:DNA-3-methyladenine glycosylase I